MADRVSRAASTVRIKGLVHARNLGTARMARRTARLPPPARNTTPTHSSHFWQKHGCSWAQCLDTVAWALGPCYSCRVVKPGRAIARWGYADNRGADRGRVDG